ncbi:hypothetical protein KKC1_09150 [Calderihabitans maritimus]|uniref:Uncharacterized protein n=1 Tax=Calderihabitans maritimus TaxID=1246530 RepID=A0A1Z5HQG0_9FIRM|nr:hypothetical protein KKC1_09150 [Calderihabitans maritimus]
MKKFLLDLKNFSLFLSLAEKSRYFKKQQCPNCSLWVKKKTP